jgi:hypothetical protein
MPSPPEGGSKTHTLPASPLPRPAAQVLFSLSVLNPLCLQDATGDLLAQLYVTLKVRPLPQLRPGCPL